MKLATYNNGQRDGELILVNSGMTSFCPARPIANTMQQLLDNWTELAPQLEDKYTALNKGELPHNDFDPNNCLAPLPRAFHWADCSAYVNHVELVRRARGAEMPASFWSDPLIYQGGSDDFLGPRDAIEIPDDAYGIDFEAEVAVITGDIPMTSKSNEVGEKIKLLMLVNDVSLRGLIPNELAKGFGFYQSKPATAFSPVAVTPDELGVHWQGHKLHLPLHSYYNCELFGCPNAGVDMTFNFAELIEHACKTRNLCAGTIIGSGTVSNKQSVSEQSSVSNGGVGYSCIAEKRMIEIISDGQPSTHFMKEGDTIKIEMLDVDGRNVFGSIFQQVKINN